MSRVSSQHDPSTVEGALLAGARAGDEHAFRELVELHRPDVEAHCYRLLASLQDAEDAFQDTMLRAWRALDGFDERSSFGTWLYRIATNVCLTAMQRRPVGRALPADVAADLDHEREVGGWIGPYPDALLEVPSGLADPSASFERRESIELAFVAALQHLPGRQRAALILGEVLGFQAAEIAATLDTTVAAVNSAAQRARARLDVARPAESQQASIRALGVRRLKEIVSQFAAALEEGDTTTLVGLLTEDAVFEMPPFVGCTAGRDEVASSWLVPTSRPTGLRALPAQMNAQPAVAIYRRRGGDAVFWPLALDVLTLRRGAIARVTAFRSPDAFSKLGLPSHLTSEETLC